MSHKIRINKVSQNNNIKHRVDISWLSLDKSDGKSYCNVVNQWQHNATMLQCNNATALMHSFRKDAVTKDIWRGVMFRIRSNKNGIQKVLSLLRSGTSG